jgi:hypothetical protein
MPKMTGTLDHEFYLSADQTLLNPQDSIIHVSNFIGIGGTLAITNGANNTLALTWPNDGWTLQQTTDLNTRSWTDAPTQVSPYMIPTNQVQSFYRLSRPY